MTGSGSSCAAFPFAQAITGDAGHAVSSTALTWPLDNLLDIQVMNLFIIYKLNLL